MTLEELHEQAWAELQAIAGAAFTPYDGFVPSTPDTNYGVLWMSPGEARSTHVGWKATDRADQFWITVASANSQRACVATADLVRARFTGLRFGDDPNAPRCKEQPGPAPFGPDKQIPGETRWWMPLQYRLATSI